ncbi:MAG: beta-ketoacyl synthase chain length factor [Deltaproteobacteria bacterium]|nr:beta-ketoacyl synthase chain length factor [Deltaproteobacteria bacterium]
MGETDGSESIVFARLKIDQWAAYSFQPETPDTLIAVGRSSIPTEAAASTATLPSMLRRRVTPVGKTAFRASCDLTIPTHARFIFCSRHGEFERTLRILTALAANEPVSPADFSLSVHNGLAGLLSSALRNPTGHTAIAAGPASFGSALIEAAACLIDEPDQPVLLVYYDEGLPAPYNEIAGENDSCIALAMLLVSTQHDAGEVIFELTQREGVPMTASSTDEARAFLDFLEMRNTREPTDLTSSQWRWRRA